MGWWHRAAAVKHRGHISAHLTPVAVCDLLSRYSTLRRGDGEQLLSGHALLPCGERLGPAHEYRVFEDFRQVQRKPEFENFRQAPR
jgi:hypothetical protein